MRVYYLWVKLLPIHPSVSPIPVVGWVDDGLDVNASSVGCGIDLYTIREFLQTVEQDGTHTILQMDVHSEVQSNNHVPILG